MSQIIQNTNQGSNTVTTITRTRTSKKDKARELYVKYHALSRQQIIQKFIEELELQEPSARTYVSECAKELNAQLGKDYKTRNVKKATLKRERAFAIYEANSNLPRKEIIEKLCTELGISHNSAATHCSLAHNRLKAKNSGT